MHRWIDVATLTDTKDLKGRFVATRPAGLLFLPKEGTEVAWVPPDLDLPRRGRVASSQELGDRRFEVTFEGIDDPTVAEAMIGMHCLIPRDSILEEEVGVDDSGWIGFAVVDVDLGPLGTATELISNPGQALLSVERQDGGKDLLIPIVDEFIVSIDADAQTVTVAIPDGLLEL